jgi:hypothetical protein
VFLFLPLPVFGNPLAYRPISVQYTVAAEKQPGTESSSWLLPPLLFYARYLSAVDGDRCPSYPSCAAFAMQAVRKHGGMRGGLMTVDRLIHERTEVFRGPVVKSSAGKHLVLDTVEMNDFWFAKQQPTGSR